MSAKQLTLFVTFKIQPDRIEEFKEAHRPVSPSRYGSLRNISHHYRSGPLAQQNPNVSSSTSSKTRKPQEHSALSRSGAKIANGSRRNSSRSRIMLRCGRRASRRGLRRWRWSISRGRGMGVRIGRSFWGWGRALIDHVKMLVLAEGTMHW